MRYVLNVLTPSAMAVGWLALASMAPASAQPRDGTEAQVITPPTVLSETAPELYALFDAMRLYELMEVLSAEGVQSSDAMEADMFPGQGGTAWPAIVAGIYAADRLIAEFEAAVPNDRFTPEQIATLRAFFEGPVGAPIAAAELETRAAYLEPGLEEANNAEARARVADGDPRMSMLTDFIVANQLIDRNVMGALNSNFAFYRGLSDGGAFDREMPEDLMLMEVWGQEAEIRAETTEWLYGFQAMAYAEISDADLQAYIDISNTEAGQVLNAVLFSAFDTVFDRVSYELGFSAAGFIAGDET